MSEALVERLWQRREDALADVERAYGALCKKISFQILRQSQDVEECLNDTLLKVWNSIPPNRPEHLGQYVCKIMRRVSLDKYRYLNRKKRQGTQVDLVFAELTSDLCADDVFERHFESEHITQVLNRFLESAEARERLIFLRRYWYLDSIKDIAKQLQMNENTIKTILSRSRAKLRTELEREGVCI